VHFSKLPSFWAAPSHEELKTNEDIRHVSFDQFSLGETAIMALATTLPEISEVIRVLAADNSRMASQLLASVLERDERFRVLEPVSDPSSIVATVLKEKPEVILVSAELDGDSRRGFQLMRDINAARPESRVVVLLDTSERSLVVEAFRAGARGVFCRSESLKSLAKCIHCVSKGQVWANSAELRYLLDALGDALPLRSFDARGSALLSRREQEVVKCVAEGLSNREIAQRLALTEHTVKNYLFRIFDKLGVSKRVEVVLFAYSRGGGKLAKPSEQNTTKSSLRPQKPGSDPAPAPRFPSASVSQ
jgi:DNA-binding NarL/FixJ family response regulator